MRLFVIHSALEIKPRFKSAYFIAEEFLKQGKTIEIRIVERKSKRTVEQNKLLWALLREIAATVWIGNAQYSDEAWHEHFKREFIGVVEDVLPSGEVVKRGISTTDLNVGEFTNYIERIHQWCAENGYPVAI